MNKLKTDVVIVGAGPAGLLMANCLGIYGISTILIEKNASTVSEPRAVSIDDESLRTLFDHDLYETVSGNLMPGYGSHYQSAAGNVFAKVMPQTREYGFPRRTAFHQDVYEAQLREKASTYPSVTLLFEHELQSFTQDDEKVVLSVKDNNGQDLEIEAQYLSACDGASSPIRMQLGIDLVGSTYSQKWLIIDILNTKDPFRHTRVYCDAKRPGISLPGPQRTRRFEFMLMPGEDPEKVLDDDNIRMLLRTHGPDEDAEVRRKCVYTFHARIAEKWREGRVLLHGDAAHLTPPFAGQGMNSGVRDIANAAWKLAYVLRGYLGPELLETYEEERKKHAWQLIEMAMHMGKVMMPTSGTNALLTQSAFRALKLVPPASDYITQMKYKPKPRYDAGFFLRQSDSGDDIVGRMFPQPIVAGPDHQELLFDKVLDNNFTLLVCSRQPGAYYDKLTDGGLGKLPVKVLCATPEDTNFPDDERHPFVRDARGEIYAHLEKAGYSDCALLMRPDRYVAAVIRPEDMSGDLRRITDLIANSWGNQPVLESAS